jgi:hypothetical protein
MTDWSKTCMKNRDMQFYTSFPNFKNFLILDENLVMIEMRKLSIEFFKNTMIGSAILDLSKHIFYTFYYDTLPKICKPLADPKIPSLAIPKIAYVDTDAYILVFDNGIDPYQMIREHSEHFDTSNFPVGNQFNIEQKYKKISGKLKSEIGAQIAVKLIATAPKCYCLLVEEDENLIKKMKGVESRAIKNVSIENYRDGIVLNKIQHFGVFRIRSINLTLYLRYEVKVGISNRDNKRIWINHSVSYAFGYPGIDALKLKNNVGFYVSFFLLFALLLYY